MDIKLFSLCKQEVPESEKGKQCILGCVKSLFPECDGFKAFSSQKRMLLAISQSLRAADIVVVAVQSNMYNATKKLLSTALDMEMEDNDAVAEKLMAKLASGRIKPSTFSANIFFPSGAEVMPTDSGINSGFALTSGGQHIIYLPIEAPRAEEVVYGSLYDYLLPLRESDTTDVALEHRHQAIIERTAEKLNADSLNVAVFSETMQEFISSRLKNSKYADSFIFDNMFPEMENQQINDYCTYTARDLRDRNHAQYGVAFSKPYVKESNGEMFMAAAIADESGTNVIRFFAEPNEQPKELFANAVDKVMLMLCDYNELLNEDDDEAVTTDDKKLKKDVLRLVSAAVGASAIIGVIVSLFVK